MVKLSLNKIMHIKVKVERIKLLDYCSYAIHMLCMYLWALHFWYNCFSFWSVNVIVSFLGYQGFTWIFFIRLSHFCSPIRFDSKSPGKAQDKYHNDIKCTGQRTGLLLLCSPSSYLKHCYTGLYINASWPPSLINWQFSWNCKRWCKSLVSKSLFCVTFTPIYCCGPP